MQQAVSKPKDSAWNCVTICCFLIFFFRQSKKWWSIMVEMTMTKSGFNACNGRQIMVVSSPHLQFGQHAFIQHLCPFNSLDTTHGSGLKESAI
jgi:hypothetical protein